jgi:succinyl-diaminopimelate desuccinylase
MIDVVGLTRNLVAVETMDNHESAALAVVAPLLAGAGFTVEITEHEPGRGTLIAELATDLAVPPLCLSGHVDTVPLGAAAWSHDPFRTSFDGDRLYGRGTSDMKGGVAAIVAAACAVGRPRRAGLRVVLTAAEETGSFGARHSVELLAGKPCGALIIAEPTGNAVVHGHKGALWLTARARGVTAHGSMPHLGDNAVYKLARAVTRLESYTFGDMSHPILGKPTLNVGTFHGGLNTNSVPDQAEATIDVRTVIGQEHAEVLASLGEWVGGEVTLSPLVDLPPVWTEPSVEWVASVADLASEVTGRPTGEPRAVTYFTDASVLTTAFGGVPTVICGPGEPEQAHVTDEWVSTTKLQESAELLTRVANAYLDAVR